MRRRLSLGLLCLTLAACARKADIIITGGMVWTGLSTGAPQKGTVALADGRILAIGDDAQIRRYADRKSTRLNSSHGYISYAVFCLKKKKAPLKTKESQCVSLIDEIGSSAHVHPAP